MKIINLLSKLELRYRSYLSFTIIPVISLHKLKIFCCLGCIHRFSEELREHLFLVGIVSLSLGVVQVLGIIITSCMFSRLNIQHLIRLEIVIYRNVL